MANVRMMGLLLLLSLPAQGAPDTDAMRQAHRAARAADCGPALSLVDLAGAPAGRHREQAAVAQVRCASSTLQPPNPAAFFAEPLRTAALVDASLHRELTTSVAIATHQSIRSPTTSHAQLDAVRDLLAAARDIDPENWMLWDNSLFVSIQLMDLAGLQAEARTLLAVWAPTTPASAAMIVGQYCNLVDRAERFVIADRSEGTQILRACLAAFETARASPSAGAQMDAGYLLTLEAAAYSIDPELRARGLTGLRTLAPDSVSVTLLEAELLLQDGDVSGAVAHYTAVAQQAPDVLEARFALGTIRGTQALSLYDTPPTEPEGLDPSDVARDARVHLEAAFAHPDIRLNQQIQIARLMVQLCDRLEDAAGERHWRSTYSRLVGY